LHKIFHKQFNITGFYWIGILLNWTLTHPQGFVILNIMIPCSI